MNKEKKEIDKEDVVKDIVVVNQLPTEVYREIVDSEGKEYSLITTEEAIKEILIKIREIHKAL